MMLQRAWGLVAVGLVVLLGGCGGGATESRQQEEVPERRYGGLAGQSCAVMVWADFSTRTEYNTIQADLAKLLQQRLVAKTTPSKEKNAPAVQTQFINPLSVVRYQREHPEVDGMPITELAPRLGVSRVVYVEIESFEARSPQSIMLLKGTAKATLRVAEVSGGQARIGFEEAGITANYPPNAPEGVVESDKVTLRAVYQGTLIQLADKLAARFEGERK